MDWMKAQGNERRRRQPHLGIPHRHSAGMIMCFAKAMGKFGATITFVSNVPGETQTLPSAIYTFTQVPCGDVGAFRLTLVAIAIQALLASELMARYANRRLEIE
jgi:molybdate transport system permease protein